LLSFIQFIIIFRSLYEFLEFKFGKKRIQKGKIDEQFWAAISPRPGAASLAQWPKWLGRPVTPERNVHAWRAVTALRTDATAGNGNDNKVLQNIRNEHRGVEAHTPGKERGVGDHPSSGAPVRA
jgi:hypothetical protein